MAWTNPETFTAGQTLTAASMNAISDNLTAGGAAMVRAERAAAQSIANNVNAVINFDTQNFDTDGMFAATANYVTINTAGIYVVHATGSFVNSSGSGVRALGIYLNPTFTGSGDSATINTADRRIAHADATSVTTGADQTLSCSTVWQFIVGDTVAVHHFQNSGGAINTDTYDRPSLAMAWLGNPA